jgi:hypothetical protein
VPRSYPFLAFKFEEWKGDAVGELQYTQPGLSIIWMPLRLQLANFFIRALANALSASSVLRQTHADEKRNAFDIVLSS